MHLSCPIAFQTFSIKQVPVLLIVPPSHSKLTPEIYPITSLDDLSDNSRLAAWITSMSGAKIHIPVPFWHAPTFKWLVLAGLFVYLLTKVPFIIRNMSNPLLWFILAMFVYCFVMSGAVYNSMRRVPFWQKGPTSISLFYPGLQSQFKAEGLIVAALMLGCGMIWVLLTMWPPKIKGKWKRYGVFSVLFILQVLSVHWLVKLYATVKLPGYPYYGNII
eukprot:TRINITY_DN372_c0_g1_i1.p1 TRINITY_DN372_c0_g1~~TRINITY_DN372_c0_g1_i1.p1  ORF type:complete len:218 (+),score=6.80 TRINITY_DN372_c0_g1_i1:317-970(+)